MLSRFFGCFLSCHSLGCTLFLQLLGFSAFLGKLPLTLLALFLSHSRLLKANQAVELTVKSLGTAILLALYMLILAFCLFTALTNRDRYAAIMTMGIGISFFLLFALNMLMVMGFAPVVGVPLPLVSWGGSSMLVLLLGFGLIQSAHVHKWRGG